jgi:hypothetical protein
MAAAGGSSPAWRCQSGGGFVFPRHLERPVHAVARGSQTFELRTEPADRRSRVRPWGIGFPGLRVGEFTAYGIRMRPPRCCIRSSRPIPPRARSAGNPKGVERPVRESCSQRKAVLWFPQPFAVTGEPLMSRRCRYIRRRHRPDGWRSVQKRPAVCHSGCGRNAVPMPSCHGEQGNPFTSSELPDGERGWANYSGVGHPCHQCVSKVFRRGVVHCVLTCRRTACRPGRFQSPGDQVSVQVATV